MLGPKEFIAYTEDIEAVFRKHAVNHHLFADDKQVYIDVSIDDINSARRRLQGCIADVVNWCSSRRLQLNASKTELIWLGTRHSLSKMDLDACSLQVGEVDIKPATSVRDLGVQLDCELTMKQHVAKVAGICFYHLRRLRQIRRLVGQQAMAQLISAIIFSRLDYCNSVLIGLPHSTIAPLQRVQNASARLVLNLGIRDHMTSALKQLHWLPVVYRIKFKICLLMHLIHTGQCPAYLSETVALIASSCTRPGLRSATGTNYSIPRTRTKFGERAFSYAGPTEWNLLPANIRSIVDTIKFKRSLKTHFFELAFEH